MAPLDPKSTARVYMNYTANGVAHTITIRLGAEGDEAAANAVYDVLAPLLCEFLPSTDGFQGADFSAAGTNVRNPVSIAQYAGQLGTGFDGDNSANFYGWHGRSTDGRETNLRLFTPWASFTTYGFRYENPAGAFQEVLDALEELSPPVTTISGLAPVWKQYVNVGVDAYWQRQFRKSPPAGGS